MSDNRFNYEINEDCFKKTKDVKSYLLFGDNSKIRNPFFTIFIPTYKRTDLLIEALGSALKQWHVPFEWEILVLDNEPYDGKKNDTERLIRTVNNDRVLYYRNSKNIRPGDNFNRGIFLSRGKWVMMLHDDDILFCNALQRMYNYVTVLERVNHKKLGAVSAKYHQFFFD